GEIVELPADRHALHLERDCGRDAREPEAHQGTVAEDGGRVLAHAAHHREGIRDRVECPDIIAMRGRVALSAVTIVARLRPAGYGGQPTPLEVPCDVVNVAKAGLPAEAPKGRRLVE